MPRRLFNRHHHGQQQHPGKMCYAHRKHDEHQRPAATQTIESMAKAKVPGCTDPTSIMLGQKIERVTADSQAPFFKAAELKRACQDECDSSEPRRNAELARARNRRADVTNNRRGK
jgi:hypothetical protein